MIGYLYSPPGERDTRMADPIPQDELIALVADITTDRPFIERNNEYKYWRDLLHRRREVSIPGVTLRVQHRTPGLNKDAHDFKNRMLSSTMKINVAATSDKTRAIEGAGNQEKFFYRYFYRWRDQRVFDRPLFDVASIGKGAVHLRINPAALPDTPDLDPNDLSGYVDAAEKSIESFIKEGSADIFVLEPIDPATLYYTPEKDVRFQAAIIPTRKIQNQYASRGIGLKVDEKDDILMIPLSSGTAIHQFNVPWAHRSTLYTIEDEDYCYHLLAAGQGRTLRNAKLIGLYKNYLGRPGFFLLDGEITGDTHPLYESNPLIYGRYAYAPQENLLNTIMLNAGLDAGQTRYALKWTGTDPEPTDPVQLEITIGSDGVLQHPPGYEIYAPQLSVGMDLTKAIEQVTKESDRFGFPKSLNRPDEVSASSGYDRAKQQDAVAALLDPPLTHWANMTGEVFSAMAHAVSEIGVEQSVRNTYTKAGRITVGETITIKPDDIVDVDINVNFDSKTTFSRIAMMEEYLKLMEGDQATETEFQTEVMGIDDMDAFRDERALDKVLKNADDLAVAAVNDLANKVKAQLEQKAMDNAGITPPAAVPPGMMPGMDGGAGQPPPMPGQMVPTNGQTLRSDRGPAMPVGPGMAQPLQPPVPGP